MGRGLIKMTAGQVAEAVSLIGAKHRYRDVAEKFGVSIGTIQGHVQKANRHTCIPYKVTRRLPPPPPPHHAKTPRAQTTETPAFQWPDGNGQTWDRVQVLYITLEAIAAGVPDHEIEVKAGWGKGAIKKFKDYKLLYGEEYIWYRLIKSLLGENADYEVDAPNPDENAPQSRALTVQEWYIVRNTAQYTVPALISQCRELIGGMDEDTRMAAAPARPLVPEMRDPGKFATHVKGEKGWEDGTTIHEESEVFVEDLDPEGQKVDRSVDPHKDDPTEADWDAWSKSPIDPATDKHAQTPAEFMAARGKVVHPHV